MRTDKEIMSEYNEDEDSEYLMIELLLDIRRTLLRIEKQRNLN